MPTKEDLIRENHELRAKLELAQIWMQREVADSISRIQEERSRKNVRIALQNVFEKDGVDILTRKIVSKFDGSIARAPKYTLERLIDAEIYWNTLQQYPQMDALPIIIAYQKILDAWIEDRLIAPWRNYEKNQSGTILSGPTSNNPHKLSRFIRSQDGLEQDMIHVIDKKYTLSIGRLYQLLNTLRKQEPLGKVTHDFVQYLRSNSIMDTLLSDTFFFPFQELIEQEVFSRKRHESKVSYSDARFVRDICIEGDNTKTLLELIFEI